MSVSKRKIIANIVESTKSLDNSRPLIFGADEIKALDMTKKTLQFYASFATNDWVLIPKSIVLGFIKDLEISDIDY